MSIEKLRYDQFTLKGSHNSLDLAARDDRAWSLQEQLSGSGNVIEPLVALELDLVQGAKDVFEWTVQHGGTFGKGPVLSVPLKKIAAWMRRAGNKKHPVITVHLDVKNQPGDHKKFAAALDQYILDIFPKDRIYTPKEVIGNHPDLVRAAKAGAWGTFAELRGKIIFCVSGIGKRKSEYAGHQPKKRLCFADFGTASKGIPKKGNRVFGNMFVDHTSTPAEVEKWTRQPGFVVRGYAVDERRTWDVCIAAGMNILSTDAVGNRNFVLSGLGYAPLANRHRGVPEHLAFVRPRGGHRFKNWSRTVQFSPARFVKPRTEEHLQEVVRMAAREGSVVRTQGAGHSFSQIITTGDTLVSLDDLQGGFGVSGNSVTVPAGIRLKDLIPLLKAEGLGLANMGSVTPQSIAGAISTGTHGTGLGYQSMPTQISALRLVDGKGDIRGIDSSDPQLLGAARLSMGMLGILTSVTVEAVPYYDLEYDVYLCDYDFVVERLVQLAEENERMLLWWRLPFLPERKAMVVTKNAPGHDKGMLADAEDLTDALKGALRGTMPRDGDDLTKALGSVKAGSGFRRVLSRKGGYEKMLTIPLLPLYHRELEYGVPIAQTEVALRNLRSILAEGGTDLNLGCEVRFVAGDTDLLSVTRNKPVCYIGVSTLTNATEVFERIEPMFRELGGRPHWGKHFNLTRGDVKSMYGKGYDRFAELRRKFDPKGVYQNELLRRLFE